MRTKFDLVSHPHAKQVDNQIKSIKSSDALAKEGIFVINPLWHAHRRAAGTREKVGGIRFEWMNNHRVQRHYKFIVGSRTGAVSLR